METARRNARGEASLQRILESTVQLLGRYGYDNTTIARIVQATRRPASSIYWYFESKDELIKAALENSYGAFSRGPRSWLAFDPTRPLLDQLLDEVSPEMRPSESEEPIRLGILLALERHAGRSTIQEPFRRRRAGVVGRIEAWWDAAFVAVDGHDQTGAGTWWMTTLTLAFLDGHYLSDVAPASETPEHHGRFVAHALTHAFDDVRRHGLPSTPLASGDALHEAVDAGSTGSQDGPARLLRVTRALVAEYGYEGATIGRICEAAGMQRSSVYWRHKDKEALVQAAVAEPFVGLFTPLTELPQPDARWSQSLESALREVLRLVSAEPDTVRAGLLLKLQQRGRATSGSAAILEGTAAVEQRLSVWIDEILPSGWGGSRVGEPMAWAIARLTEGLMLVSTLGRPVPADRAAQIVVGMVAGVLDAAADTASVAP